AGDKDFWAQKPYAEWTEKDLEKILSNSPWAKTIAISMGGMMSRRGGGGDDPFDRGGTRDTEGGVPVAGGAGGEGGGGGGGMRGGGRGGFGGGDMGAQSMNVVVAWWSLPIRQAMARRVQLRNPEAPKDQVDRMLASDGKNIDFVILRYPGMGAGRQASPDFI